MHEMIDVDAKKKHEKDWGLFPNQMPAFMLKNFAVIITWLLPVSMATAPDNAKPLIFSLCLKCKSQRQDLTTSAVSHHPVE